MASILLLIGLAIAVLLGAWWLYRRWREVDSYFEHEQQDPPISDLPSWFGGDRGF